MRFLVGCDSPNHEGGVTGDEREEIWMLTEAYAIRVMGPPSQGLVVFFPEREAHFYSCPLLYVNSLRISWAVVLLRFLMK